MLKIFDIVENPYTGVYIRASDNIVLVPPIIDTKDIGMLEEVFEVPVHRTTIGNTNIIGSVITLNSHGAVASNIITNDEFQDLSKRLNITILREKNNALGNGILVSEDKALLAPFISRNSERAIQNFLDVETMRGTIAGQDNVGMSAVVTSKGLLCHPKITPEEKEILDDFFGMTSAIGTVNFGIPLIGAGLAANSHGAVVGSRTTGVELNRIEHALDLI